MTEVKRYYKSKYSKNYEDNYDGIFDKAKELPKSLSLVTPSGKILDKDWLIESLQKENVDLKAKIDKLQKGLCLENMCTISHGVVMKTSKYYEERLSIERDKIEKLEKELDIYTRGGC